MACYLCAYQRVQTPSTVQPLPAGSPALASSELATCWRCSVWACSAHGTRYGQFECAMCTPATAIVHATAGGAPPTGPSPGTGVAGAAVARARGAGYAASPQLHRRMHAALDQIAQDHRTARELASSVQDPRGRRFAPYVAEPNLVSNLGDVIRRYDVDAVVPSVRGLRPATDVGGQPFADGLSLDAISAAVWDVFGDAETLHVEEDAVWTTTGAYLLGVAVADAEAGHRLVEPDALPDAAELPAPWEVSHPVLLDPALWMVGTALRVVSQ